MATPDSDKSAPVQSVVMLRCVATGNYDKPPIASLFRENGRYVLREHQESDFGIPIRNGDSIEVSVDGDFRRAT
jgi:hypothetical protein